MAILRHRVLFEFDRILQYFSSAYQEQRTQREIRNNCPGLRGVDMSSVLRFLFMMFGIEKVNAAHFLKKIHFLISSVSALPLQEIFFLNFISSYAFSWCRLEYSFAPR